MQEYLPVRDMKVNNSLELHPGMKIEEVKPHIEDLYKFMEKSNEKYKGQFIPQDWVAAYATIFARCAIDEVGLFDPLYNTGCEDLDLMNRLGKYGYRTGQALDSFVFHFGGISRSAYQVENREFYDKQDKENHVKYKNKWDKRKVVIFTGPAWEPWNKQKVDEGMAGSETWAAYLAPEFVKLGFKTIIYNDLLIDNKKSSLMDPVFNNNGEMVGNVIYRDYTNIESDMEYNVIDYFITSRTVDPLRKKIHALRSYVMIHDIWLSADKNYDIMSWHVEKYAYLSEWHKQFLISHHHIPENKMVLTANGQDMKLYEDVDSYKKKNQSVYSSSPDRGLYQLLKMVPMIREQVLDFELIVAYGFFNWESMAKKRNDTASMALIEKIKKLLEQPGVKYVDRISKRELAHYEKESKVWLYPSWFDETFAISAVSAGLAKNAIVSTDRAGLKTTVGSAGILLPSTGLYRDMEYPSIYIEKFVKESIKMLKDEEYRKSWADKAYTKMKEYTWKNVAMGWIKMFDIKDT